MSPSDPRRATLPRFTDRIPVQGLSTAVSPYLLGTVQSPEVIEQAFERGINFFLLGADLHWPKYEATRQGLRRLVAHGVRDRIVVAALSYTHLPNCSPAAFREVLEAVPELECIDLLLIGGAEDATVIPRTHEYRAHLEAKCVGARAMGACFESNATARMSIESSTFDFAMTPLHAGRHGEGAVLRSRRWREGTPPLYAFGATFPHRDEARLRAVGLPEDKWVPRRVDYYRYALTWAAVDGAVLSMSGGGLDELAAAIEQGPLDEEEVTYLTDLDDLVHQRAQLAE